MKKLLSKSTIAKMRAVVKAVLAEPEFYDQQWFPTSCMSACCAAGWAVWLDDPAAYERLSKSQYYVDWKRRAEGALGLGDTGHKLFVFAENWPKKFYRQYAKARTPLGRAKAMAARWEHFIATNGAE